MLASRQPSGRTHDRCVNLQFVWRFCGMYNSKARKIQVTLLMNLLIRRMVRLLLIT